MKKVLLAASMLIAVVSFAGNYNVTSVNSSIETGKGRHIPESQVPVSIVNTFHSQYPGATNAQWEVEKEHGQLVYQVEFRLNGQKMKVKYPA